MLTTRYFGPGGVEAYGRLLARALVESGHEVEVLSYLAGETQDDGCPGRYLGAQGRRPTPWGRARLLAEAVRRGRGYRLVVCGHVAVAPLGAILNQLYGVPYAIVGHGIEVWGEIGKRPGAALRRAAQVIAVSRFTADRLAKVHGVPPGRLAVVHPCVDPALLRLAEAEPAARARPSWEGVTLLTVARLSAQERYKGCDTVIRALPAVVLRAGPVRYVIAGDGDDRPRLEALAQEHGVADAVVFAGRTDRRALPHQYRACDVFVMPSVFERRVNGWGGEGFGIVYIEAAAFGRPVIAGNSGGAPEAVLDGVTGLVVDGGDIDALIDALIRLASDPNLRARMGEAGQRWIREHFTFERFRREVGAVVNAAAGAVSQA